MLRVSIWDRIPDSDTGGGIRIEELQELLRSLVDQEELLHEIGHLKSYGFVTESPSGELQRANGWFPLQRKLVAVELKLARLREAIQQATRYQRYADESYVALPYHRATKPDCRDAVSAHGLGLLGVQRASVTVIVSPKEELRRFPVDNLAQVHAVERMWQAIRSQAVQH